MKSYIKIYGPPIFEAIKELEKIAVDMPEVCILDTNIVISGAIQARDEREDTVLEVMDYFNRMDIPITEQRCNTIISKSGESLGEYDFFFEWFTDPNIEQVNMLIKKIDAALAPLGTRYTIVTR